MHILVIYGIDRLNTTDFLTRPLSCYDLNILHVESIVPSFSSNHHVQSSKPNS
jgi:hypothetical protein